MQIGRVRAYGDTQRQVYEVAIDSFKVRQQLTRELYSRWGFHKIQVRFDRVSHAYSVTKLKDSSSSTSPSGFSAK